MELEEATLEEETTELEEETTLELDDAGVAAQAVYTLLRIGANTFSFTQLPLSE
jgi:hypothetical protein